MNDRLPGEIERIRACNGKGCAVCGACPNGCGATFVGCNPNRWPDGPWWRCYKCGGLWSGTGKDLLVAHPNLTLPESSLCTQPLR